jgi:uncharacterized protein YqfA (UPF0365 family)
MEYIFCGFILLVFVSYVGQYMPVGLWLQARSAGVPVGMLHLATMRLRRVDPTRVILPLIMGRQAGLTVTEHHLEAHYLAGGDLNNVIKALIEAHKAGIDLDFQKAAAIDLAGRDVLEAIAMMVNPKVLQTQPVSGMAKDGIQVTAKCRVTLKANIDGLVGGAGEDTILARVGQGIVTAIGSATSHKRILENPGLISRQVLDNGLDKNTAFEIISIDVMDLDIGRNIGAQLQMDRAEADKQIAQAHAEERRAEAVAQEEEYKAKVEEMRAKVVEEEARVPRALAAAIRGGKFKSAAH